MSTESSTTTAIARPIGTQALLLAVACLNILLFFRHSILSGFAQISADQWDGRLLLAVLDHWRHAWRLEVHWRSPIYFYPAAGAIGYSDAFFVHGALYSLFRSLGANWFAAYELVNITLKLIGFYAFFHLCHRILGIRLAYAILGASLFFQLHSTAVTLGHSQLLVVCFVPLMLILIHRFVEAVARRSRRGVLLFGASAITVSSAWAMSGVYMAWYFFLYASCVAVLYAAIMGPSAWRACEPALRHAGWAIAALGVLAMLANVPFLATYLPTARETGMHDLAMMRSFTGTPFDVINIGTGNLLYGSAADRLHRLLTGVGVPGGERTTGFTPVLLLLAAFGLVFVWRQPIGIDRRLVRVMVLVLIALWLATFRIGHFLAWDYVFTYFPGGRATRVPPRFQIFVGPFVILAATLFLDRARWFAHPVAFALVALLLLAEQVNTQYGWGIWRQEQEWVFTAISDPPPECRAFFVLRPLPRSDASPGNLDYYAHSVDAMLIAERFNLPTLNGIETFSPAGWDLYRWQAPDYLDRVLTFARRAGVMDGLCSLDIPTRRWSVVAAK